MIGCSRPFLATIFLAVQLGIVKAEAQCINPDTPQPLSDADLRTVVITKERNPGILDADAFSLANTLDNIIKTARGAGASQPTAADREALLETLLEGLRADTLSNDKAGITFNLRPRHGESALTAKDLLDAQGPNGMKPVGLFNRLDLAPKSLSNCGEHRIVYVKHNRGSIWDRFSLIFEAALPNPHPTNDIVGCQQVAALWSSLKSLSDEQVKQALVKFYYSGGPISPGGLSFEPVIDFRHFGLPSGQVRANALVLIGDPAPPNRPWHLRQWNIELSPDNTPTFNAAPLGQNPVPAYFGGTPADAFPADQLDKLQASFQNEFLGTNVVQLTSVDAKAANTSGDSVSEQELIANVGVDVESKFDAVDSESGIGPNPPSPPGASQDSPTERAIRSGFSAQVATQIGNLKLDAACGLTAAQVLNRMGAMTCGGCHQFSNNREIAPNIHWPLSLAFVHIDEKGALSELLLKRLLPARAEITNKIAAGTLSFTPPIASADVLKKSAALREKLKPAQGGLQEPVSSEIEALSIDLRRSLAQEPGAFVMFRKPD